MWISQLWLCHYVICDLVHYLESGIVDFQVMFVSMCDDLRVKFVSMWDYRFLCR